jgi:hypothetical protein
MIRKVCLPLWAARQRGPFPETKQTLAQQVALDGAVIDTTPQDVALLEAYDPCEAHSIEPPRPWT